MSIVSVEQIPEAPRSTVMHNTFEKSSKRVEDFVNSQKIDPLIKIIGKRIL